jgi:hypothetical protein
MEKDDRRDLMMKYFISMRKKEKFVFVWKEEEARRT